VANVFAIDNTDLQGWDIVETNVRIHWNPVYKAFHRIRWCGNETNFFSSNSNVMSTRQTCGQRSGMAVGGNAECWH